MAAAGTTRLSSCLTLVWQNRVHGNVLVYLHGLFEDPAMLGGPVLTGCAHFGRCV
jgi:hypothetical protein